MAKERQDLGQRGETIAATFLKKKGYEIIEKNFRCKAGEIDIVAKKDDVICLVEVRTLKNPKNGMDDPLLSIDKRKRNKLKKLALYYIHNKKLFDHPVRIDCIGVVLDDLGTIKINHVEKAV